LNPANFSIFVQKKEGISMRALIERYRNRKRQALIRAEYHGAYAFAGIGAHALQNLYPVLDYLKVNLKYVITRSKQNADLVSANFKGIKGTNNLQEVLSDPEVRGVFVCTNPSQHFSLSQEIIKANKHLFVEKPPCSSLSELQQLIELQKGHGVVTLTGLQKRYAPVYDKLKKLISRANYYSLKYQTGAYPEGDVLMELFIHPIDLAIFLFGKADPVSVQKIQRNISTFTYLIHLKHDNGVTGSLELSTDFSWVGANEQIRVNTDRKVFFAKDATTLLSTKKPAIISGIPTEKIRSFNPVTEQLYHRNDFLPVKEHNQIYTAGYYDEITTFLNLSEGGKARNKSNFEMLTDTFSLIEKIQS
jgi:virulence factor